MTQGRSENGGWSRDLGCPSVQEGLGELTEEFFRSCEQEIRKKERDRIMKEGVLDIPTAESMTKQAIKNANKYLHSTIETQRATINAQTAGLWGGLPAFGAAGFGLYPLLSRLVTKLRG